MGQIRSYRNLDVEVEHMRKLELWRWVFFTINSGYLIPVFSGRYADEWERPRRDTLLTPEEIERRGRTRGRFFPGFLGWYNARYSGHGFIFANEWVLKGGHEKDGMPIVCSTGEGLVLGIDPKYEAIFMGPDAEPDETLCIVFLVAMPIKQRVGQKLCHAGACDRGRGRKNDSSHRGSIPQRVIRKPVPLGSFEMTRVNTLHR